MEEAKMVLYVIGAVDIMQIQDKIDKCNENANAVGVIFKDELGILDFLIGAAESIERRTYQR